MVLETLRLYSVLVLLSPVMRQHDSVVGVDLGIWLRCRLNWRTDSLPGW
jgi:hypothetical protein